jgi:hypothetical protein
MKFCTCVLVSFLGNEYNDPKLVLRGINNTSARTREKLLLFYAVYNTRSLLDSSWVLYQKGNKISCKVLTWKKTKRYRSGDERGHERKVKKGELQIICSNFLVFLFILLCIDFHYTYIYTALHSAHVSYFCTTHHLLFLCLHNWHLKNVNGIFFWSGLCYKAKVSNNNKKRAI